MRTLILALAVLCTGCATGYQPDSLTGGYSETRLSENTFQVSFRGNFLISAQKVADYNLLRCAELTMENGFRYFIVVKSRDESKTATWTAPRTTETEANVEVGKNIYGDKIEATGHSTTKTAGGETYTLTAPASSNLIVCFSEMPTVNGMVFDAQIVRSSIKAKYRLK